ncbi:alpha/beta fold hydrolase [Comamonas endophytica]|uniref:Alpha/beta hydrolase n=1 Tax=Comamonas endophytica TaxID=2949090 RepID=A0ABY6GCZ0_9BURK|nr:MULTISPECIES: alpha/beta hydrolase [unclassified Acidovorax]MCD2512921.1 alpha/beta hydrolase [Acidovorax sp. D4N7]UYG52733.1 alpha/beta hydrolase [Acidovorax sp. 5MLIR]
MIQTCDHVLPHGITLRCRTAGMPGRPVLMLLHGFPEGAFIWDALLAHFSAPENGGFRCVAPDLRGYGGSSSPLGVEAYQPRHLVQDIRALIAAESPRVPLAALVAHDWGGAVAWSVAAQHPDCMDRLMILNAPHAGAFLRELREQAEQRQASEYMRFLRRADAPQLLAENDWQRTFRFFAQPDGRLPAWLTPALQDEYRAHWSRGLQGPCHYYGASPLYPPAPGAPDHLAQVRLPEAALHVAVPTLVLWGMNDPALRPGLLEGLEDWVPRLQIQHLRNTSHWVVHERPARVIDELERFVQRQVSDEGVAV